ncbi:MAG: hypothetical protein MK291_11860 [Planctomycetes bacterium]|nr:hypothetical protein [Planctomycetota bacterium]
MRVPPLTEFSAIADELKAGDNPYVGRAALRRLRVEASDPSHDFSSTAFLRINLATEALKHGRVEESLSTLSELEGMAHRAGIPKSMQRPLIRTRALTYLRSAEVENCVKLHNGDCCIFPLEGGGVHAVDDPVRLAADDYRSLLEQDPSDLGLRWLLNLCHQAMGDWPEAVPPALLISPASFASDHEIGRFRDESWKNA